MPFVSKAQERACYAKNDPNWNCEEYAKKHSKMTNRKRRKSSKKRRKSSRKRRKSSRKRRKSSRKLRKSSKKRRKSSKKRRKSSKKRRKSSKKRRKSSKKRRKSSKKRRKSSKKRRKSSRKRKKTKKRKKTRKRKEYNDNSALRDFRNSLLRYRKNMLVFAKKELDRYNKSITNEKNRWYLPINLDGELTLEMVNKVLLGEGADGFVVRLCKGNDSDCDYAMKVQRLGYQYEMEVEALMDLQSTNNVPKVYDSWKSNNRGYIVMEYIPECDDTIYPRDVKKMGIRYDKASELLKKLEDKGWLQVDMHLGNIRCRDGDMNKLVLIDLGWIVKKGKGKYPEHPLSKRWEYDLNYDEMKIVTDHNFNHNFYDPVLEKYVKNVPDEKAILKAFNKFFQLKNLNKTINPSSFHDGKIVYNDSN